MVCFHSVCAWAFFLVHCSSRALLQQKSQIRCARSAWCGMWSSGTAGMFLELCLQEQKPQFSRRSNSPNCHWSVLTRVRKAPSERTQNGAFILMKFCLTQAITHSPSSDFCEVPAQKDALNGEPEEASWDLQLWASPSTFVFWERDITEVAENSEYGSSPAEWGSPKGILVFCWGFFPGKNWKREVYLICTSSMDGRKNVEKSFCILWIPLALGQSLYLYFALSCSVQASQSMINTFMAQSPQQSADFYPHKNSCPNKSSVLWSCTPSNPSVWYHG